MFKAPTFSARANQAGFSLVEVLVTIVILSIGMLGSAGMQTAALQANTQTRYQVVAAALASELAEATGDNSMLNCGGGSEAAPLNAKIEERTINVFHLSKDSASGEASLTCATYDGTWKNSTPLVEGVESFQVLYGTDTVEPGLATSPNVTDSVADRWLRADQLTVAGNAAATAGRRTVTYKINVMTEGSNGVEVRGVSEPQEITMQVGRMSWRKVHIAVDSLGRRRCNGSSTTLKPCWP